MANFGKGIIKSLVYYPECDCLYYLHSVIDYITKGTFFIDYRINSLFTINKCSVNNFIFEDIIKDDNRNIILKNINATMYLEIYMDNFDGIASEIYDEENILSLSLQLKFHNHNHQDPFRIKLKKWLHLYF